MELKAVATEFKVTKAGTIEGHAAVFGNRDSWGDIIQPGAFKRTLSHDHTRVKVLWQHDPYEPIGKPTLMTEDDKGLYVEAQLADTVRGRDAHALLRAGIIDEMSIGYEAIKWSMTDEGRTRLLEEVKLYEFSPVTWAANELAKITSVKHASDLNLILDKLNRLEWARGKLESTELRAKATAAIENLRALLDDPTAPPTGTPYLASTPGTSHAHAALSDLDTKLRAVEIRAQLRAVNERLRGITA